MLVGVPPVDLVSHEDDDTLSFFDARVARRPGGARRAGSGFPARSSRHGLLARLLGTPDGERDLTDVRHVAEAVHEAAVLGRLGPTGQREWLARQVADADAESTTVAVERSRRLESDADAVQVLTVHGAKGLEFPVVLAPFEYDRWSRRGSDVLQLHSSDGDQAARRWRIHRTRLWGEPRDSRGGERREESAHLLRGAHQGRSHLVLWWAPTSNTATSALNRLLFGEFSAGQGPPAKVKVPSDEDVHRILTGMAASSDGVLAVERATPHVSAAWAGVPRSREVEGAAPFDRSLDLAWRRLSYTALTRGVDHVSTAAESTANPRRPDRGSAGWQDAPSDVAAATETSTRARLGLRSLVRPSSLPPACRSARSCTACPSRPRHLRARHRQPCA